MLKRTQAVFAAALAFAFIAPASGAFATTVLVMDSNRVLNTSAVGVYVKEQLAEIARTMDSELEAEGDPVRGEIEQFQADTADLTREALAEREDLLERQQDIQGQLVQLNVSEQVKARELVATRAQALAPVRAALDEVLQEIVDEMSADILIEREVLIYAGDAADVTDAVIEKLNARMTETPVERVRLPLADESGEADAGASE